MEERNDIIIENETEPTAEESVMNEIENENETPEAGEQVDTPAQWILRVVKGAIIGTGAILPGISGGVLSIVFGIYEKMMAFLANPRKDFMKNIKFFLPIVIGLGVGVVLLAKLLGIALDSMFFGPITIWFFMGAIVGTLPMLLEEAGSQGRKASHWIILGVSTCVSLGLLLLMDNLGVIGSIKPNFFWWMFCGAMTFLGAILPGMSPSSILMFMGLYNPMSDAIGNLQISMLIPYLIGGVAVLLLLSKLINWLFNKYHSVMYHIIIGVVIASTVLVPMSSDQAYTYTLPIILCCVVTFVLGAALTVALGKLEKKVR